MIITILIRLQKVENKNNSYTNAHNTNNNNKYIIVTFLIFINLLVSNEFENVDF